MRFLVPFTHFVKYLFKSVASFHWTVGLTIYQSPGSDTRITDVPRHLLLRCLSVPFYCLRDQLTAERGCYTPARTVGFSLSPWSGRFLPCGCGSALTRCPTLWTVPSSRSVVWSRCDVPFVSSDTPCLEELPEHSHSRLLDPPPCSVSWWRRCASVGGAQWVPLPRAV